MIDVIMKCVAVSIILFFIYLVFYGFNLYIESVEENAICDERGGVLIQTHEFISSSVCLDGNSIIEIKPL